MCKKSHSLRVLALVPRTTAAVRAWTGLLFLSLSLGCGGPDELLPSLTTADAVASAADGDSATGSSDGVAADAADAGQDALVDVAAQLCQGQSQCPAGTACFAGICAAELPCKTDKTCLALDAVCDSAAGHCVQCEETADCAQDWLCKDRVCTPPAKKCATTKECAGDQVCDKAAGQCVQCVDASDCSDGQGCVENLCVNTQCSAGASQCKNDKTRQVCSSGVWTATACASDEACFGGACLPLVCEPGTGQCQGDQLQLCSAAGTGWGKAKACASGQVCKGGACVAMGCSPGQKLCTGNKLETCTAQGLWQTADCGPSQACATDPAGAQCKPVICQALSKTCQGNAVATCNATGTAKTLAAPCETPATCKDGACVTPQLCTPGATSCATDKSVAVCVPSGNAYETLTCAEGKFCVNGKCAVVGCAVGLTQCAGAVLQTCVSGGVWQNSVDCGLNGATCQNGKCEALPCIFGNYGCVDGVPAFCTKDAGWSKQSPCPGGQTCVNKGECKAKVCTPFLGFCQGSDAMLCDSTGTVSSLVAKCGATGQVCTDGQCGAFPKICSPGAKQCAGDVLQTCNESGTVWQGALCSDGDPCTADTCSQGQCTKSTAADGTACASGSGCGIYACKAGQCAQQVEGLWQKSLALPEGSAVAVQGAPLPDGSAQWLGSWTASAGTAPVAWLGRTSAAGQVTASWPISGNSNAWYSALSAAGTWIGRGGPEVLLMSSNGVQLAGATLPLAGGFGQSPYVAGLAAHPAGGAVAIGTGSSPGGLVQSELFRLDASAKMLWLAKLPAAVATTAAMTVDPASGQIYAVVSTAAAQPATEILRCSSLGSLNNSLPVKFSQWPYWTALQGVTLSDDPAGKKDFAVAGRIFKACPGCGSDYQDIGVARIGADGELSWHKALINPQGKQTVIGGIWQDGPALVVVASLGSATQAGWVWYRLRLSDGALLHSKSYVLAAAAAGSLPVAVQSGTGAVILLGSASGSPAAPPLYRVDPWGNPLCGESQGCASKTYASCDDGNPCSLDTCQFGVCMHPSAADGVTCASGKACSGGLCK